MAISHLIPEKARLLGSVCMHCNRYMPYRASLELHPADKLPDKLLICERRPVSMLPGTDYLARLLCNHTPIYINMSWPHSHLGARLLSHF